MNQERRNSRVIRFFTDLTVCAVVIVAGTLIGCGVALLTNSEPIGIMAAFCVGLVGFPIAGALIEGVSEQAADSFAGDDRDE